MLVQSLSGVRGIFGQFLSPTVASLYAHAYQANQKPKKIVIGMDTRQSGPAIKTAMIGALSCQIIDVGILPTPAVQHAVRHFGADGGIIITASHNPAEHNGFKFLRKDGSVLYEHEMQQVIAYYQKISSKYLKTNNTLAQRKREEALKAYQEFLFSIIGKKALQDLEKSKLKVLIDPNGGAGIVAKDILEHAGMSVVSRGMEHAMFYRQIEPTKESLSPLLSLLKKEKAIFAAGFDCDADRVEIMLSDGQMLSGNEMIALAAQHILKQSKNPKKEVIVVNNATSSMVREVVQSYGATYKEVEVGEANVVQAMKKHKSKVGGEGSSSGVIIAPGTSRDGILATLLMASLICTEKKSLAMLLDELPSSYYLKEKVEVDPKRITIVKKVFADHYRKAKATVQFSSKGAVKAWLSGHSFVWCRDSKTESGMLRIISDAPSQKEALMNMQEALKIVNDSL